MATTQVLVPSSKQWNSLQRMQAGLVLLLIADVLFLIVMVKAQSSQYSIIKTITEDSAPSIIAAQHIKVDIAEMDAAAANELLIKGPADVQDYNNPRQQAAEDLITAAKNITYQGERAAIETLELQLGQYETKIQRSRDFHERNDPQAAQVFREAAAIVDTKLLPAAEDLARINRVELDKAFSADRSLAAELRWAVVLAGAILLLLLIYIQRELTQRTRRVINPALLAASLLTIGLAGYACLHLLHAGEDLRIAKEDAFASIYALWQARAVAYSANSYESRYLLSADGGNDEAAFFSKAKEILSEGSKSPKQPYGGFLGDELANVTFTGEKAAATDTKDKWQIYLKIDARIRQLRRAGKLDAAIQLCLGQKAGESDFAFSEFDKSLMRTTQINQDEFDVSTKSAFAQLEKFDPTAAVGTAVIAICFALGLLVRIREFL